MSGRDFPARFPFTATPPHLLAESDGTKRGESFSCIRRKRRNTARRALFMCSQREANAESSKYKSGGGTQVCAPPPRLLLTCQIKTHLCHAGNLIIRDAPVEDDRAPMLLIHMISGQDGRIDVAKKIAPVCGKFEIHPNMSLSLKRKGVCLPIMTMTHEHPIVIVKRHIRIGVAQCERHGKKLFARFHSSFSGECAAVANIFKYFFLKKTKQILLLFRSDSCTKEDYAI